MRPDVAKNCITESNWKNSANTKSAVLANGTLVSNTQGLRGTAKIKNFYVNHEFYVMKNLRNIIILGMDILEKLGVEIFLRGQKLEKSYESINNISTIDIDEIGLQDLPQHQREDLQDFIHQEMRMFDSVKGATPLVKHEIKLIDETPLKQRYPEIQQCRRS